MQLKRFWEAQSANAGMHGFWQGEYHFYLIVSENFFFLFQNFCVIIKLIEYWKSYDKQDIRMKFFASLGQSFANCLALKHRFW
ncbi:hypothetical protein HMPREF9554_01242 [Treponema phagedenis F0421]|nr:hypothetical protein HMPREF9554_01242 [Treponema phagedenis F0421]